MGHFTLKHLKQFWPLLLGVFFLLLYLSSVPGDKKTLATPAYDIANLITSDTQVAIPTFKDITLSAGINIPHTQRSEKLNGLHDSLGAGACLFDFDNDGWIDLLTLNGAGTKHFFGKPQWWQSKSNSLSLYRNIDGKTFEDVTATSGLSIVSENMGCNAGDLDNDGDADVFITNRGVNQLWLNNGNGRFSEVTAKANIQDSSWSTSSRFGDVNQDGLLDIYVTNYIDFTPNARVFEENAGYDQEFEKKYLARLYPGQSNTLYINQGKMKFLEQAKEFGVANSQGRGLSSNFTDVNSDGWPDLIVANDHDSENKVYLNIKGQRFKDASTQSQLAITFGTPSIISTPLNTIERSVLFATKAGDHPRLYEFNKSSRGSIIASDISESQKLHTVSLSKSSWGTVVADVNSDGRADIVFSNGSARPNSDAVQVSSGQPNTLLLSQKTGGFVDASEQLNPKTFASLSSRCIAYADFNNDGAPDLFFTQNNDLPQLLLNQSPSAHWIGIELVDQDNRATEGSVVTIESNGVKQARHAGQQQGLLCSGDSRLLFSLDQNPIPVSATITWPDGEIQTISGLQRNQYNKVIRNQPIASTPPTTKPKIKSKSLLLLHTKSHQLTIVERLVQNKFFKEATHELSILREEQAPIIRERAYQIAFRLPEPHRQRFLQNAITDDLPIIRQLAIRAIKQGEDENLIRWLLYSLFDSNASVACETAAALEHFFREEEAVTIRKFLAIAPLIRLAGKNKLETQICAIKALGESDHFRSLETLTRLLNNDAEQIKINAAHAIGLIKEKSSLSPLTSVFNSPSESPSVRAAAFNALISIDRSINIKALFDNIFEQTLTSQELGRHLETLVLILSSKSQITQMATRDLLSSLIDFRSKHFSRFSASNHLDFLKILNQSSIPLTKDDLALLREISKDTNSQTRLDAARLLLTSVPKPKRTNLLVAALGDAGISNQLITELDRFSVDKAAFYKGSERLALADRLTALWKIGAQNESISLKALIIKTLNNSRVSIETKRSAINQMKTLPHLMIELCAQPVLSSPDTITLVLELINGCLADKKLYKAAPEPLRIALEQQATSPPEETSTSRLEALRIVATRKESWARDIIISALTNDKTPIIEKESILNGLPEIVSKTLRENLNELFVQNPKSPLAALIAKYRGQGNNAFVEQAIRSLKTHIQNGDEDNAMLFADALIATMPQRVLPMLIKLN